MSVCVVGSPMEVAEVVNPTEEQIDKVHRQYMDHLESLFEAHKSDYGISPTQHLNIIWSHTTVNITDIFTHPLERIICQLVTLGHPGLTYRFYRAACNAMHGIAVTILSVCLSDACIVSKLNDALQIFWYHTKRQSL